MTRIVCFAVTAGTWFARRVFSRRPPPASVAPSLSRARPEARHSINGGDIISAGHETARETADSAPTLATSATSNEKEKKPRRALFNGSTGKTGVRLIAGSRSIAHSARSRGTSPAARFSLASCRAR